MWFHLFPEGGRTSGYSFTHHLFVLGSNWRPAAGRVDYEQLPATDPCALQSLIQLAARGSTKRSSRFRFLGTRSLAYQNTYCVGGSFT